MRLRMGMGMGEREAVGGRDRALFSKGGNHGRSEFNGAIHHRRRFYGGNKHVSEA